MAAPEPVPGHIHLPSVHIRSANGSGFDYEEDFYVRGRGRHRRMKRVIRLAAIEGGREVLIRETVGMVCPEEMAQLEDALPLLMDEGNPEASEFMQECARREFARQLRIAGGQEAVCRKCGCSETRACSGGCMWATATLCSRCA
jgi:hypothetical protein